MNLRLVLFVVATAVPSLAFAQAYKCKQANGTLSFQEQPCAVGSVGAPVTLRPVTGAYAEPEVTGTSKTTPRARASNDPVADYQRRLADEQTKAQNDQIRAHNRMLGCNAARHQLGVLKESRPVYSYNNKGERVFVADEDRAAQVSSAERRVAELCN
jgi:hypothetical protein